MAVKISVLSGKGGTGKTLVATNLASAVKSSTYVDMDVEEPNGAIFLKPDLAERISVTVPVPRLRNEGCNGCGVCVEVCRFNALAVIKNRFMLFPELCHHCGACVLVCPEKTLEEMERTVGIVSIGKGRKFLHGHLNVGEPMAVPLIKALKGRLPVSGPVFLDCPPGVACAVVHAVEDSDYCLLVAEPTPFGLHDLAIAVKLMDRLHLPRGVVINKGNGAESPLHQFCRERSLPVLAEIPFSLEIAGAYSRGELLVSSSHKWQEFFSKLYVKVLEEANHENGCHCKR